MHVVIWLVSIGVVWNASVCYAEDPEFTNSIGMVFERIPSGTFEMGTRFQRPLYVPLEDDDVGELEPGNPLHEVKISRSFLVSITEVTQQQWKATMKTSPWAKDRSTPRGDKYPAVWISWEDAVKFCNQLSIKEGRHPCYTIKEGSLRPIHLDFKGIEVEYDKMGTGYRLPTEAEWEYFCRAGARTTFHHGDDIDNLSKHAWYWTADQKSKDLSLHLVGQKKANAWGLFDVHGNAWEWCQDGFGDYESRPNALTLDPIGVDSPYRVYRGGGWWSRANRCGCAHRNGKLKEISCDNIGFRVVLVNQNGRSGRSDSN